MYKFTIFLLISLFSTAVVIAQDKPALAAESKIEASESDFNHLVSASDVANRLRMNYGVKGSVLLSKTMSQILYSFSNQQQAQISWQTAINQVTKNKSLANTSFINSQYHSGQTLSQFTHGLDQQKWQANRINLKVSAQNVNDFFETYDDLTVYLNLTEVWKVLLKDISKQENIQWHDVFAKSLDLFSGNDLNTDAAAQIEVEFNFFEALSQWQANKYSELGLAELTNQLALRPTSSRSLYSEIIRYSLEKQVKNFLSASLTWLNIAQQFALQKNHLPANELSFILKFIEENDTWFLSKEQELLAINIGLPEWMEHSFHNIKALYKGSSTTVNLELATIYQMLEPQLEKYMASPFRQKIRKSLEVCLNISDEFLPYPQEPIDKNQFEGCIKDMVIWASQEASSRELAGSLTKVNSQTAIDRALQLPSWQTINIILANASDASCLDDSQHLPNPFEWSIATESLLWFADRWPAYMNNYPQNLQISKIIQQGVRLIDNIECLEKSKKDTLNSNYNHILQAWQNVKSQIKKVAIEFNENNLATGSSLDLLDTSEKPNNYSVAELKINACDVQTSCGVHIELESTKALFAMFPNHLLVANQLKLGTLKLCYDNVGWENRRAASTGLDNNNVTNYHGNFSFTLKGSYNDELVFSRKLIDKNEYKYLFGANTPEVLNTACPLKIVGQKISTTLERGTYGLVPNRLTFLTASRADETRILEGNWASGDEWNNLITGDDIQIISENQFTELNSSVQQAYQQKATQLQATIYKSLLNIQTDTDVQKQLAQGFNSMQRSSKLFASMNYILQMNNLMLNDELHGMFYGSNKIPDVQSINELYQSQININSLIQSIDDNLKTTQEKWNALEKSWSNQHIKDILFRLNSLIE